MVPALVQTAKVCIWNVPPFLASQVANAAFWKVLDVFRLSDVPDESADHVPWFTHVPATVPPPTVCPMMPLPRTVTPVPNVTVCDELNWRRLALFKAMVAVPLVVTC